MKILRVQNRAAGALRMVRLVWRAAFLGLGTMILGATAQRKGRSASELIMMHLITEEGCKCLFASYLTA